MALDDNTLFLLKQAFHAVSDEELHVRLQRVEIGKRLLVMSEVRRAAWIDRLPHGEDAARNGQGAVARTDGWRDREIHSTLASTVRSRSNLDPGIVAARGPGALRIGVTDGHAAGAARSRE